MQGPRQLSHSSHAIINQPSPALTKADWLEDADPFIPTALARSSSTASAPPLVPTEEARVKEPPRGKMKRLAKVAWRHANFLGPGLVASVAYIDPGNWSTDLAAGASYGYAHLFIVLMAGLMAILYQIMATRLGVVSGKDLAEQCRASLHNREKHTMLWRWGLLYPLYVLSEIAVIFTDLAELLGSAIAINLLIPAIPLYAGVLLTGVDVFLVLFFFNSYPSEAATKSMRVFEAFIGLLVLSVLGCFIALLVKVSPDWGEAFLDFLPNTKFIPNGGLYAAVGIIGATVMPHALFLGSRLATMQRYTQDDGDYKRYLEDAQPTSLDEQTASPRTRSHGTSLHFPYPVAAPSLPLPRTPPADPASVDPESQPLKKTTRTPSLTLIRHHVQHASIDIALSLTCFALVINASILILAAAAFTSNDTEVAADGNLFSAHELIKERLGAAPGYLFALALLASGQCASITVTLAGQVISEGFINWSVSPLWRRLITRGISMIPSVIVAVAVGNNGINALLVGSQVALSIILPFVIFPLVAFTSNPKLMTVPSPDVASKPIPAKWSLKRVGLLLWRPLRKPLSTGVSFASPAIVALLGWFIFVIIIICNIYALIQLGEGDDS